MMTPPPRVIQLAHLFESDPARQSLYAIDTSGQIWKKDLVPPTRAWESIDGPPGIIQILVIPETDSHYRTLYALDAHGHLWEQTYHWLKPQGWTRIEGPPAHAVIPALSVLSTDKNPPDTPVHDADSIWACHDCHIAAAPELLNALVTTKQHIMQLADMVNNLSKRQGLGEKVRASDFYEPINNALTKLKAGRYR